MDDDFSPAAMRAVDLATRLARSRNAGHVTAKDLLVALISDEESQAVATLRKSGVDWLRLREQLATVAASATPVTETPQLGEATTRILRRARILAVSSGRNEPAGTEDLLAALLECDVELSDVWRRAEVQTNIVLAAYHQESEPATLPVHAELLEFPAHEEVHAAELARILDANANRVRESLRVLEDYARFAHGDRELCARVKECRHQLGEALSYFVPNRLLSARDTSHDVGIAVSAANQYRRENMAAVIAANCKRAQESLRTLEEYSKIESPLSARQFESIRYCVYDIERLIRRLPPQRDLLDGATLYWLADPAACVKSIDWMIDRAAQGGVQAIQLRDTTSPDGELLERAARIRKLTRERGLLFIVNNRPDIARLVHADGVHIGQLDLPLAAARRVVGPDMMIGVSTHDMDQARRAVAGGADYLGIGPVFASQTKSFHELAGLEFVAEAARGMSIPAFCIGGIEPENVAAVLAAGATRIAVSHCLCAADDPLPIARLLSEQLGRRRQCKVP